MKDPENKGKEKDVEVDGEEEGIIPERSDAARTQRLRRIKDQVRNGTYRVDSSAVADKIVGDAVEKIRSRSQAH